MNPAYSRPPVAPAAKPASRSPRPGPRRALAGRSGTREGGTMATDTETSQLTAQAAREGGRAWWRGQRRMSTYRIEGGAPLRGRIRASGAKNAATKQIVTSLLTDEEVTLHNVPQIGDVAITIDIVQSLGARVEWTDDSTLLIHAASVGSGEGPVAFSGLNRIPVLLIVPLLHRYGTASVPLLGGDDIGARPLNFHVGALQTLGATISMEA